MYPPLLGGSLAVSKANNPQPLGLKSPALCSEAHSYPQLLGPAFICKLFRLLNRRRTLAVSKANNPQPLGLKSPALCSEAHSYPQLLGPAFICKLFRLLNRRRSLLFYWNSSLFETHQD